MKSSCFAIACIVWVSVAASARAEEQSAAEGAEEERSAAEGAEKEEPAGGLGIGVGGFAALSWGDRCAREASDVVGCQAGSAFAGLQLLPRWRLSAPWSVGALAAVGWGDSSPSGSQTWWRVEGEGRWYPFGAAPSDFWLGVGFGLTMIVDDLDQGELGPAVSYTTFVPEIGVAVGVDFRLSSLLALGPELRLFLLPLGATDYLPGRRPEYATQIGCSLGATATLWL